MINIHLCVAFFLLVLGLGLQMGWNCGTQVNGNWGGVGLAG